MSQISVLRRERRKKRKKQRKINARLKHRLFGHLAFALCCYCKKVFFFDQLTVEHKVPLCLGGTNDPSNIALACGPCNHERGKIAWKQKQSCPRFLAHEANLQKNYEQYSAEHQRENRESSLQGIESPNLHHQREGV